MKVQIISPARNAMQSGTAKTGRWEIRFLSDLPPAVDPLMGWVGMPDTTQEVHMHFPTKEEAIDYANKNGLLFEVVEPKARVVKPKSYAANFAYKKEIRA